MSTTPNKCIHNREVSACVYCHTSPKQETCTECGQDINKPNMECSNHFPTKPKQEKFKEEDLALARELIKDTPTKPIEGEWSKRLDVVIDRNGMALGGEVGYLELIDFIKNLLLSEREAERSRIIGIVENGMSYVGVLDSNEKRRGYDLARQEFLSLVNQIKQ